MTDNEIKTYLPFLAKYCKSEYNDIRVDEVLLGAFDIINRQNTEIDRLNKLVYEKHKENNKLNDYLQYAKADTVKEFAERAKEHFLKLEYKANTKRKTVKVEELEEQMEWVLHTVAIKTLDNLLKEMAGDTE